MCILTPDVATSQEAIRRSKEEARQAELKKTRQALASEPDYDDRVVEQVPAAGVSTRFILVLSVFARWKSVRPRAAVRVRALGHRLSARSAAACHIHLVGVPLLTQN